MYSCCCFCSFFCWPDSVLCVCLGELWAVPRDPVPGREGDGPLPVQDSSPQGDAAARRLHRHAHRLKVWGKDARYTVPGAGHQLRYLISLNTFSHFILMFLQERSPPCVEDFLYICDDAYKKEALISTEASILQTLSFDINIPIPYRFLRRYAKVRACVWRVWIGPFRAFCRFWLWHHGECLLCCLRSVCARAWTRWLWPVTTARWVSWRWSWCQREARCWPPPACWWRWSPKTWEDG